MAALPSRSPTFASTVLSTPRPRKRYSRASGTRISASTGHERRVSGHNVRTARTGQGPGPLSITQWFSTVVATSRGPREARGALQQNEPPVERPDGKRTVSEQRIYSWEQWEQHRNSNRYFRHLAAMPTSRIVQGLRPHVTWVCSVATGHESPRSHTFLSMHVTKACDGSGVAIYGTVANSDIALPHLTPIYKPFEMTSFALALLLVFRTDASYDRFQSARSSWRVIISQCREINRLGSCYFHKKQDAVLLEALNRWTVALAWCFRDHLLSSSELEWNLKGLMNPEEIAAIHDHRVLNKPAFVFVILTQIIQKIDGDKEVYSHLLNSLRLLEETLADCERLLKTPIPLSYTRHTSRFLILYLTFLPFGLWDECGWAVIPISGLLAFFLIGIDEIGVQIEEPFSILPLERYCQTILQDALASPLMLSVADELLLGDHQNGRDTPDNIRGPVSDLTIEEHFY